jgi:maltose phosphorylase
MVLGFAYIKQTDVLHVSTSSKIIFEEELKNNNFTNRSPFMKVHFRLVHSIQAALLDKMDMAYTFYLRTSRLDLDDYNKLKKAVIHRWPELG